MLIFLSVITLNILLSYYINKTKVTFLHESTIAIFLGFMMALFLKVVLDVLIIGIGKKHIFVERFFLLFVAATDRICCGVYDKKNSIFSEFSHNCLLWNHLNSSIHSTTSTDLVRPQQYCYNGDRP